MRRFQETALGIKEEQAIMALKSIKDGTVIPIPLKLVVRNENIRNDHSAETDPDLESLKASIKEVGLLQHPIVTFTNGQIICVSGHRRLAACESLKFEKVSCVVRHFDSLSMKQMAQLLENTARRGLHPLDIGLQLNRLREAGMSQVKLQDLMKKDRKTIGRFQKMALWPDPARKIIYDFPEKLKTGTLLQLASRDLSDKELIKHLKLKAGLLKPEIPTESPIETKLYNKTVAFFAKEKVAKKDQTMLLNMMVSLGLLSKTVVGNRHGSGLKASPSKK